jgi:hypothetical protein
LISESNYRHARESGYRDHERLIFIVGLCVMTVVLHVDERHFGEIRHAPREQDADDAVPLAKPIQGFNGLLVRQTIRFGGPSGPKTAGPAVGGPVEFSTCRATPQQETAGSRPSGNRRRYGCRGTPMPYPKFIQPSYDQAGAVEQVELVFSPQSIQRAFGRRRLSAWLSIFHRGDGILPRPVRPALLDQLAGVDRNRQPYAEGLRRIGAVARCHGVRV